jgi:hypothetical protein
VPLAPAGLLVVVVMMLLAPAARAGVLASEDPLREVPAQASLVSAAPDGPPTPASGWAVAYADAFDTPFGTATGDDDTLYPNNCAAARNCAGFNADELEVMSPSAVLSSAEGLKLTCTYMHAAQAPGAKHYVCGTVRGHEASNAPGYRSFVWTPGNGQTLVFQAIAKFPPNSGEADPAFWSNGPPWTGTELDFFEGGGWSYEHTTGWRTDELFTAWFAPPELTAYKAGFASEPSAAFHTYTLQLSADNTYSVWIDGVLQPWADGVGPAVPNRAAKDTLIVSYALRTCATCRNGFVEGSREFDVRSIAVYEDRAHAGVGIEHAGLAPGTVLGE